MRIKADAAGGGQRGRRLSAILLEFSLFASVLAFAAGGLIMPAQAQMAGQSLPPLNTKLNNADAGAPAEADTGAADKTDISKWLKKGDYDFAYDAYVSGHFKTAFDSAMPRARAGDPQAQALIAILYMEGRNVPSDPQKALYWYARAAKGGDPQAQLRYGIDIFNGLHGVKDQKQGEIYIRQAMMAGVPQAYFYYGQIAADNAPTGERSDSSLKWFLQGAALGDANAAYAAAQILAEGTDKIARNEAQARALLEAAANSGSVAAQIDLARFLAAGRGGPKDEAGAFDLMKIVAVGGVPPAQITLARYYNEGIGTKPDVIKAAAWYLAAKKANYTSDDLEDMMTKLTQPQMRQAHAAAANLLNNP